MTVDFKNYLVTEKAQVEEALEKYFPSVETDPSIIHQAMNYSLLAGGKRLRPLLVLLGAEIVGGDREKAFPAACAVECIHVYSLIHDDLPAMDDADLRRGKAANHIKFGEAMAILAGDGLLTYAFELLGHHYPRLAGLLTVELARAAGSQGMIAGQVLDITAPEEEATAELLEKIHIHKTGVLIRASLKIGALVGGGREEELELLDKYGKNIGLAFQIVDDILDITSDETGKSSTDESNEKLTYPALFGLDRSRQMARELLEEAKNIILENFATPAATRLTELADFIYDRRK